jgi:hypothetical protein
MEMVQQICIEVTICGLETNSSQYQLGLRRLIMQIVLNVYGGVEQTQIMLQFDFG